MPTPFLHKRRVTATQTVKYFEVIELDQKPVWPTQSTIFINIGILITKTVISNDVYGVGRRGLDYIKVKCFNQQAKPHLLELLKKRTR